MMKYILLLLLSYLPRRTGLALQLRFCSAQVALYVAAIMLACCILITYRGFYSVFAEPEIAKNE